jgi:hypothetical protein
VALLAILILLCAGVAVPLFLEDAPLPFEIARATSDERQRLVRMVRSEGPGFPQESDTRTLALTERDINVLLSWGLSCNPQSRKAALRLAQDSMSFSMSLPARFGGAGPRYLNLEAAGDLDVEQGTLKLRVDHCRIGSVELPRRLLHSFSPLIASWLNHNRQVTPFLHAIRDTAVEPDSIQLTYGRLDLPAELRRRLLHPSLADKELLVSTRAQVDRLLLLLTASPSPELQPAFGLCLKTAFTLAHDRSAGRSPILENRAAIFALGMVLGHRGIEDFMGSVLDSNDLDAVEPTMHRVLLSGRSDWTRHFCVSAVIATFSDKVLSDAAGLLKEELDAEEGGSGFSFADLLADRAGAAFALTATRDEPTARAIQDRLARGCGSEDIFPPADGLPEGIPDAELQSRYGGVGGEEYRRLIAEIERRVAACPAYQICVEE